MFLHPYAFVLKEGREFGDDFLDYSLEMMQIPCYEKLPSPAFLPVVKDKDIPLEDPWLPF